MISTRFFTAAISGGAFIIGSSHVEAQTFGAEYTTEWQTDFKGGYDWLNLLKTTAEIPVTGSINLETSTISTAKTGDSPLVEDLLTYSNIEADNIALTFARLGLGFSVGQSEFFVGINNVNEDYFTSDMTSFFTNSSCGISPTLSCNYDIANYPLASWCVHYRREMGCVSLQTSLYPGQGYSRILGHDNLFTLKPGRDGIFSISSIDYKRNDLYCVLGIALHHGMCIGDDLATPDEASPKTETEKRFTAAPWILSEFNLPHNLGLHAHASFATVERGCRSYAGAGLMYNGARLQPAMAVNYASFTDTSELSFELSCRIHLVTDHAYVQPTLHLVSTDNSQCRCVGMFRLCVNI